MCTGRDVLGAKGLGPEQHAGCPMCDLTTGVTYGGMHASRALAIGHGLTGMPARR